MRRYIYNGKLNDLDSEGYDVVIIGGGVSGMFTALNLPEHLRILVALKKDETVSSSWFAQGGIAAVTMPDDNIELHIKDTLIAGAGLCKEPAVRVLATEGPGQIQRMIELGVPVDTDAQGRIDCGREGGHSRNRIVHSGKDATGKQMVIGLNKTMRLRKNVTVIEDVFLTDVLTDSKGVRGVILYDKGYKAVYAPNVVIATGGIGRIYKYTTNPSTATGDGISAASRAGAVLENMEFVQFHPTALALRDIHGQHFLISEAVRGDGGLLYDINGDRIMKGKHPLEDLAPRDIVAREIFKQMRKTGSDKAYLDIKYKGADFVKGRFPTIYHYCLEHGIDITKELIPVVPAQHYFMGGIQTDLNAMTNIDGLYAVGESSCTGVQGANRLASNSLLECLVFGSRCAKSIAACKRTAGSGKIEMPIGTYAEDRSRVSDYRERIRTTMSSDGGIIRNGKDLESGVKSLRRIIDDLSGRKLENIHHIEALNMAMTGEAILSGALNRKKSAGAHFREDDKNVKTDII